MTILFSMKITYLVVVFLLALATAELLSLGPNTLSAIETDACRESSTEDRCVIEELVPFSKSHIWKLLKSFYDRRGVESWSRGHVPHFVSSNAFVGRSYVNILQGYLRDLIAISPPQLDVTQPLYIIELGSGHGKLSFYILKALTDMKETLAFPLDKIVLVMTDFTETNYKFWREHPKLKPYVANGLLDFAIFDAVNGKSMTLANSGVVLSPGSSVNPVVVVANYVINSLTHDIFQVKNGLLMEGLFSLGSNRTHEPDALDPAIVTRMENRFQYNAVPDDYYSAGDEEGDEPHLERILHWYRDYFGLKDMSASLLMPVGGLRALRRLSAMSSKGILVMTGDKAYNQPDHFVGVYDPPLDLHGSTFSVMVNYHALGMYVTSRGGFALHNPQEQSVFQISAFVLPGSPSPRDHDTGSWTGSSVAWRDGERLRAFPHLHLAFRDNCGHFGPADFFVLYESYLHDVSELDLVTIIAVLKLSNADPDVFFKLSDRILDIAVSSADYTARNDLRNVLADVWAHYFELTPSRDVGFQLGRIRYQLQDYAEALGLFQSSIDAFGQSEVTYFNQGLCFYKLDQFEIALDYFKKSLDVDPGYEKARGWKEHTLVIVGNDAGEK